eukprot:5662909-Pleurochrysis_carterae.AAC.2
MHKSPSLTVHTLRDVGKAPSYSHLHDEEELGEGDGEDGDGARVALARGVARQLESDDEASEAQTRRRERSRKARVSVSGPRKGLPSLQCERARAIEGGGEADARRQLERRKVRA